MANVFCARLDTAPSDQIADISGVPLDAILMFGMSLCNREGARRLPWSADQLQQTGDGKYLNESAQNAFLSWISADYATIRAAANATLAPGETYLQFRFNPLRRYPLIRPQRRLQSDGRQVYLAPCSRLVLERVTSGLYHDLARHNASHGGANPFKVNFGMAFQAYVGRLLSEALGEERVVPEWKYGGKRVPKDSVDWIVVDEKKAVFVEVKQSATFLETKQWGLVENLRSDMSKTLGKAIDQLVAFEDAFRSGSAVHERIRGVGEIERLIVTYDKTYYLNSIVRDEAFQTVTANPPAGFHVHVISIDDFEYLLALCPGEGLFDLLKGKRTGKDGEDSRDFNDWQFERFPNHERDNRFLSREHDRLFKSWGLPLPIQFVSRTAQNR